MSVCQSCVYVCFYLWEIKVTIDVRWNMSKEFLVVFLLLLASMMRCINIRQGNEEIKRNNFRIWMFFFFSSLSLSSSFSSLYDILMKMTSTLTWHDFYASRISNITKKCIHWSQRFYWSYSKHYIKQVFTHLEIHNENILMKSFRRKITINRYLSFFSSNRTISLHHVNYIDFIEKNLHWCRSFFSPSQMKTKRNKRDEGLGKQTTLFEYIFFLYVRCEVGIFLFFFLNRSLAQVEVYSRRVFQHIIVIVCNGLSVVTRGLRNRRKILPAKWDSSSFSVCFLLFLRAIDRENFFLLFLLFFSESLSLPLF